MWLTLSGHHRAHREDSGGRSSSRGCGGALFTSMRLMNCFVSFLYNSGPPDQGWYCHSGLGAPTTIINKENAPWTSLQVHLREAFSQLGFTFDQMTLAYVKLKKPYQQRNGSGLKNSTKYGGQITYF